MRGKVDPKILIKVFEGVFSQERTRVHNNLKIKHLTLKKTYNYCHQKSLDMEKKFRTNNSLHWLNILVLGICIFHC